MTEDLHKLALKAAEKAHAPYSDFPVGAAIRTTDGRTFAGCNVENAAYPEGWCAETSAIAHMVMDGGGKIAEVAVLGLKADLCTPCGGCRQRLAEFGTAGTRVHLCNREGLVETVTLGELLPKGFDMGKTP
ncbi:cytidine deaminase [Salaquimonas pukyongi]|uniref:cytidine deaminase n=1 Tax=Salaquimonas pukyongi TaxID=2712698 RepID=UPI00096B701C|nr:cytidine deaminase [Salaquimonas pukyongi]